MAMSQSHSTVSSIAFLISPSLRLWNVFWRVRSPEMRSILTAFEGLCSYAVRLYRIPTDDAI
eukprot:3863808-Rhodomonas_salina.1